MSSAAYPQSATIQVKCSIIQEHVKKYVNIQYILSQATTNEDKVRVVINMLNDIIMWVQISFAKPLEGKFPTARSDMIIFRLIGVRSGLVTMADRKNTSENLVQQAIQFAQQVLREKFTFASVSNILARVSNQLITNPAAIYFKGVNYKCVDCNINGCQCAGNLGYFPE